jgi:hypothetical protein
MLVVIAIIGLLASLIVPAVSNAMNRASDVSCKSNLRTLQLANQMYATENRGWFVSPTSWDVDGNQGVNWHFNPDFIEYFVSDKRVLDNPEVYWNEPYPLLCPAARRLGSNRPNLISANYGINIAFHAAIGLKPWGSRSNPWRYSADMIPASKLVAFTDCLDWLAKNNYDSYTEEVWPGDGTVAYRHNGKAFAVHFDGHVASYSREQMQDPTIRSRFTLEN